MYLTYAREVLVKVLHSEASLNENVAGSFETESSIQVSKPFRKLFGIGDRSRVLVTGLQHEIHILGDGLDQALSYQCTLA